MENGGLDRVIVSTCDNNGRYRLLVKQEKQMEKTGLVEKQILLPNTENMTAWATIACDQFTSEKEYWEQLENAVRGEKTTLDMVLPEIYLDEKADERIAKINKNIKKYIKENTFHAMPKGYILTVRKTPYVKRRIGLIGAVDLEEYDYSKNSKSLVRATEGTIEERIPPRLKIRKDAEIEFPHIMVLFDDEKREITEKLFENRSSFEKVYDFELNMGGGSIEGYFIPDDGRINEMFSKLLDGERLIKKYGKDDKFAFAVGDGNHSLATAKTHWNNLKKTLTEDERKTHPARFALAEFVNVYDEGIYFEAIHRFIKGVDVKKFIDGLTEIDCGNIKIYDGKVMCKHNGNVSLPESIKTVDEYVKKYITENGGSVDYVHGEEHLKKLIEKDGSSVGIFFDKLDKSELFKYVSKNGAFPRKTFSMGEGIEKRYYLEGSRITR